MQKLLITLCCLIIASTASAQYNAKIYKNLFEYRQNKFIQHQVMVEKRTKKDLRRNGGGAYKVYSSNNPNFTENTLKYAQLVVIRDTVLVNCDLLNYTGYTPAYYKTPDHMYFSGPSINKQDPGTAAAAGLAGGAIGGAIYLASTTGTYEYAIDLMNEKIYVVNKDFVKMLLGKKSDLYKEYKDELYYGDGDINMKYIKKHYESK